nr:unnamed protein product [Callosobruchus analis]
MYKCRIWRTIIFQIRSCKNLFDVHQVTETAYESGYNIS